MAYFVIKEGEKAGVFPLYNKNDLAKRWGVTRQVVKNWENRHPDFPKRFNAFLEDNSQTYYAKCDVERWERSEKFKDLMQLVNKKCLIPHCNNNVKAKNLCINHYANYIYQKNKGEVETVEQFIDFKKS